MLTVNYDRLGVAYIQKARETGDVTYYNLAAKALETSVVTSIVATGPKVTGKVASANAESTTLPSLR